MQTNSPRGAHSACARRAFRARAVVCNCARNALGSCPQNGDMFWYRFLQRAPDARNCLNAHISWPRACHVQVHSGSHAQTHARLHMAMHAMSHQASLVQQKTNAHIEYTDGADTVHDARSDLYQRLARHRLVAHNAHNLQNLCSATQNQVRKHACGNARDMLNTCAKERKRTSVPHFGEHQNCMATHMSCVRTSRLSVRLITCASTCMLADTMCSSRATSASRGTTTQNLYMDARVNVCGTHIGYISAQHVIAAARNIYNQAAC